MNNKIVFLIQSQDRKGILSATTTFFSTLGFNILHCQQHTDAREGRYFMRIELNLSDLPSTRSDLEKRFARFAEEQRLTWRCHWGDYRSRIAILVSKTSHCLYDLLFHVSEGDLFCDIPLIISNHPDLESVANLFRIPYYHLPSDEGYQGGAGGGDPSTSGALRHRSGRSGPLHADPHPLLHRSVVWKDHQHPPCVPPRIPRGEPLSAGV